MSTNIIPIFENVTVSGINTTIPIANSEYLQLEISGDATSFEIRPYAQVTEGGDYLPIAVIGNENFKIYNYINKTGFYQIDTKGILNIKIQLTSITNGSITCKGTTKKILSYFEDTEEGKGNFIYGEQNEIENGDWSVIFGEKNIISGSSGFTTGTNNKTKGNYNSVGGNDNIVDGNNNIVYGNYNEMIGDFGNVSGNNNIANSNYVIAAGVNNIVGARGFRVIEHEYTKEDWNNHRYYLDSIEGIEVGDEYTIVLDSNYDFYGKITNFPEGKNLFDLNTVINDSIGNGNTPENSYYIINGNSITVLGEGGQSQLYTQSALNLEPNKEYTISYYVTGAIGSNGPGCIDLIHEETYATLDLTKAFREEVQLEQVVLVENYKVVSTFTTPSNISGYTIMMLYGTISDVTFSNIQIEEGKIATEYEAFVPAPCVEVDTYISPNSDIATTIYEGSYFTIPSKPLIGTISIGKAQSAIGSGNVASAYAAFATGYATLAEGKYSFTSGRETKAGYAAVALNRLTEAIGEGSLTFGQRTKALYSSKNGVAGGFGTVAGSENQLVFGKFNIPDTENKYIAILGNGVHTAKLSNAVTVDWQGNIWLAGNVFVGEDRLKLITSDEVSKYVGTSFGDDNVDGAEQIVTLGYINNTNGKGSITIGQKNNSEPEMTILIGTANQAKGTAGYGAALGYGNQVLNGQAYLIGKQLLSSEYEQVIVGRNNDPSVNGAIFAVGNGVSASARSNALVVKKTGDTEIKGKVIANSFIVNSSTPNSTKKFEITVDDEGKLLINEIL